MSQQHEPIRSIMYYLRAVIRDELPDIVERYSYTIPFYNIGKKPMLYLNVLKGTKHVDVGFVHGILLEQSYPILQNNRNRKQVRSWPVHTLDQFDEIQFRQLLQDARSVLQQQPKAWFL